MIILLAILVVNIIITSWRSGRPPGGGDGAPTAGDDHDLVVQSSIRITVSTTIVAIIALALMIINIHMQASWGPRCR